MKNKFIISLIIILFSIASLIISIKLNNENNNVQSQENCAACKHYARTERFNESDSLLTPEVRLRVFQEVMHTTNFESITSEHKGINSILSAANPWVQKGPYGMYDKGNQIYYSGRVFSLSYCENEFFYKGLLIGSGGGGLWRQDGTHFKPISDKLPSGFIGAVAIHPSDYNLIFVGTGHIYEKGGAGIFRTVDGGLNWELLPVSPIPTGVAKILVLGDLVLVASDSGIFKSSNLGISWKRVLNVFTTDISKASDGTYFLAGCPEMGVYKSNNWGNSWELLCEPFSALGLPLPGKEIGRVSVQISKSNKNIAYVLIGNASEPELIGIYKTTDKGDQWQNISTGKGISPKFFLQPNFNNVLVVHPFNSNIVWAGGVLLIRSSNGGLTWNEVGATTNTPRLIHGDIHALMYVGDSLFVGSDGGIFVTTNEGVNWSSAYNRLLPTAIFHNFAIDKFDGNLQVGGMQDNGIAHNSRIDPNYWVIPLMGDGVDASITASPSNYFYCVYNGPRGYSTRFRYFHDGTGATAINEPIVQAGDTMMKFWYGRICADPISENVVYTNADKYVYWSTNYGNNWSRMNSNPFSEYAGEVCVSKDGSSVYVPVYSSSQRLIRFDKSGTSWLMYDLNSSLPTNKILRRLSISNRANNIVYAIMNNDIGTTRIFMSTNKGSSWKNITGTLPVNLPIYDIVDHPDIDGVFIVGTEMGCYITTNSGTNWWRWSSGMPAAVCVKDLELTYKNGQYYVVAATWGRSIFERPISAVNPDIELVNKSVYLKYLFAGQNVQCSLWVKNIGNFVLNITSVFSYDTTIVVRPTEGVILPGESLKFYFTFTVPERFIGSFNKEIFFNHDAGGIPQRFCIDGFVGDPASYRTFPPESLVVKKETKRKTVSNTWCFVFDNDCENRYGAKELYVEFKKPVLGISNSSPFMKYEKLDENGKKWKFFDGMVEKGTSAQICVITKKLNEQIVTSWWWIADISTWEDDFEVVREGVLCGRHGTKLSETFLSNTGMPNTANLRMEIFKLMPFNKENPLVIGVPDPNAKNRRVAFVAFAQPSDLLGSLMPGRSGKKHDGPPRPFDFFDNDKKMIGPIKKLTPDKQSNKLFAELVAFKLNLYASDLGITPPHKERNYSTANNFIKSLGIEPSPWRSLKYKEIGHPLNNKHLHEIDSLANRYMSYCDSSEIGSAEELYSALYKINRAFVGPIDTVSFASQLVLTGVRPIAEVPFLERDDTYRPVTISSNQIVYSIPDEFILYQNYPNPFNPITTIEFYLPVPSIVTLKIYDIIGREVATLINKQEMDEGSNEINFDASNFASGIYIYWITAEEITDDDETTKQAFVQAKKMILLK